MKTFIATIAALCATAVSAKMIHKTSTFKFKTDVQSNYFVRKHCIAIPQVEDVSNFTDSIRWKSGGYAKKAKGAARVQLIRKKKIIATQKVFGKAPKSTSFVNDFYSANAAMRSKMKAGDVICFEFRVGKTKHKKFGHDLDVMDDTVEVSGSEKGTAQSYLIQKGAECGSKDTWLGRARTVDECALKAKNAKAKYFVYGTSRSNKRYYCYAEWTDSAACTQGFIEKSYNFYGVGRRPSSFSTKFDFKSNYDQKVNAKAKDRHWYTEKEFTIPKVADVRSFTDTIYWRDTVKSRGYSARGQARFQLVRNNEVIKTKKIGTAGNFFTLKHFNCPKAILAKMQAGDVIQLQFRAGAGGGKSLHVKADKVTVTGVKVLAQLS